MLLFSVSSLKVFLCLFKSFSPLSQGTPEAVEEVGAMLVEKLPVFIQSGDLEVQERACCILQVSNVLQPLFLQPGLTFYSTAAHFKALILLVWLGLI